MQTENKPLRLIQSSNSASAAPLSCAGSRWLMDNQPRSDNLPATDVEALVRQYRELLGDLPANVLALAIHETLKTWSYRSMPLPGDIRKKAAGEYERIRTIKLRAKTAAMYLRWQR
jgi:hypothetical protein